MIKGMKELVRPFISVAITIAVVFLGITGKIEPKDLLGLALIVIGFHFGEKASRSNGE